LSVAAATNMAPVVNRNACHFPLWRHATGEAAQELVEACKVRSAGTRTTLRGMLTNAQPWNVDSFGLITLPPVKTVGNPVAYRY